MTDSRTRCASQIGALRTAIARWKGTARKAVEDAQAALTKAPDIALKTADQLLEETLRPATQRVAAAVARLQVARSDNFLRRFLSVRAARLDVAAAEKNLELEKENAEGSEEVARRVAEAERRKAQNRAHTECMKAFHKAQETHDVIHRYGESLMTECQPVTEAIHRGAWLAADTEILLGAAAEHTRYGRWREAAQAIRKLTFQQLPSDAKLNAWTHERNKFVARVEQKRSGFSAIAPFQGLAESALALAEQRCHEFAWQEAMGGLTHWSDRWHALPRCLASPMALIEPVQWVVYWAFLTESQAFAEELTQASSHEDVLTGVLSGILRKQLQSWAKRHLQELGYPRATAALDFVQMAGLKGEALTGGDLGIIIHLQVGDLRVHKVALLQAKISENGAANIGSKPSGPQQCTQLQKLRDPERDFFLFYHTALGASPAALPTVTAVAYFVRTRGLDEAALARSSITIDTRREGLDLASFAAFGLCTPANGVGKDVPAGKDPLEVLKAGGRTSLPSYVVVVSVSDEEHDYQPVLTLLDKEGYRPIRMDRARGLMKDRGLDGPTYDGPQF